MHVTCANPQCGSPMYRFGGGMLRAVPVTGSGSMMFIWLCNDCLSDEQALEFSGEGDECLVPAPSRANA